MPNFDTSTSPYLTVNQAAKHSHVSIWTIYRWLENGRLKGSKINRQWQIPESCLTEALQGRSYGACPRPREHELTTDPWQWLLERLNALGPHPSLNELTRFVEEMEQVFSSFTTDEIEDLEGRVIHLMASKLARALRSTVGEAG